MLQRIPFAVLDWYCSMFYTVNTSLIPWKRHLRGYFVVCVPYIFFAASLSMLNLAEALTVSWYSTAIIPFWAVCLMSVVLSFCASMALWSLAEQHGMNWWSYLDPDAESNT